MAKEKAKIKIEHVGEVIALEDADIITQDEARAFLGLQPKGKASPVSGSHKPLKP